MEQPSQFRSALNGFNREDVVRYMEFINNKHTSQVAQLTNELEYLRGKQDTLDAGKVTQLEKELSAAQAENETLHQRIAELEKQLAAKPEAAAPTGSELEAYRRAERVERTAKERAKLLGQQTAQVLDETSTQVEDAASQLSAVSTQMTELLARLQTVMDSSARTVREAVGTVHALGDGQD